MIAATMPIILWQYPAAHLEVLNIDVDKSEVTVGETFTVTADIANTGKADATEVSAMLSVFPEGSARVTEDGYTKLIGTVPRDGSQTSSKQVSWELACKEACNTTVTIDAEGFDEYGWHKKQQCQSTGNFIAEAGCYGIAPMGYVFDELMGEPMTMAGGKFGIMFGESSGLIGPFILQSTVKVHPEDSPMAVLEGTLSMMGVVIPDLPPSHWEALLCFLCHDRPGGCPDSLLDLLEWVNMQGVNKDAMVYIGVLQLPGMEPMCYSIAGGLFTIINGNIIGGEMAWHSETGEIYVVILPDGEYCSTMAKEALRPIDSKFIEPDSITVKQLEPETAVDLEVEKLVDDEPSVSKTVGEEVTFTISVENLGPADATSIVIHDVLPEGLNFESWEADQGLYYVSMGLWHVGDLEMGDEVELTIVATVNTVGEIENLAAVEYCDQHDIDPGNNASMAMVDGQAPEAVEDWEISVDSGYNLISLPLIPEVSQINLLTADLEPNLTNIRWYDPDIEDFVIYSPAAPWPGGNTLLEMTDGWGYWVNMTGGDFFEFDGWELVAETDPPSVPPSYAVEEGWNLIGFKSTMPKLPEAYLSAIAGKYVVIYGYDADGFFIAGTPGHDMLQPGLGYWIALLEPGTIYP
jgi:uncharacterized repeat protein (TIGR01451 family)